MISPRTPISPNNSIIFSIKLIPGSDYPLLTRSYIGIRRCSCCCVHLSATPKKKVRETASIKQKSNKNQTKINYYVLVSVRMIWCDTSTYQVGETTDRYTPGWPYSLNIREITTVYGNYRMPLYSPSSWYHTQHVARLEPRDRTRICTVRPLKSARPL